MPNNEWVNPEKPLVGAFPWPACPHCTSRLQTFAAIDEANQTVQKTACLKCGYVARIVSGFGKISDADVAVFK
jgi:Zn ribbon nucleic-acid-binding protein